MEGKSKKKDKDETRVKLKDATYEQVINAIKFSQEYMDGSLKIDEAAWRNNLIDGEILDSFTKENYS